MGDQVFSTCSNLATVVIGDKVESIGEFAFHSCVNMSSVTFGSSITSIGKLDFFDCDSLTVVALPDSVTSIGESAFNDCSNLINISTGESLVDVGDAAFNLCTQLQTVTFPATLETIGESAFAFCVNLDKIYAAGNAPAFNEFNTFAGAEAATVYYFADTSGWGPLLGTLSTEVLPEIVTTDGNFGVSNNEFGFTVVGDAGQEAIVQVSTDFVSTSWVEAGRIVLTNGSGFFVDANWTALSGRYYRIVWP
jgi:hypothetical protein|tara:strand:- start:175806 stop:176555 length:750 start_codon:yes stop_codon:yes gene_type:complete